MPQKNILFALLLFVILGVAAHADEKQNTNIPEKTTDAAKVEKGDEDQWFDLKSVGEEIIEEKKEIPLTPDQALEFFEKEPPQFKPDWIEKLKQPVEPAPKARKIPPSALKLMRKGDDSVFVEVIGFSKQFAQIMILRRKGNYLWYYYEECLASFKIPRAEKIDEIFGLKALEKIYSFRWKGIGYGSTSGEVAKALGKPDGYENSQSEDFYRYYYLQDDVTLEFNGRIVRLLTPGVPDWVKKEIKEHGIYVQRR